MLGADLGFTESHTLILIVDKYGEGSALANHLEACHIITGAAGLSPEVGTSGLRIGVQEVTRWGMTPADASDIAECIVAALSGGTPEELKPKVAKVSSRFDAIQFTVD